VFEETLLPDANLIDVSQVCEGEAKSRFRRSCQPQGVRVVEKSFRGVNVDVDCSSFVFGEEEWSSYNEIELPKHKRDREVT